MANTIESVKKKIQAELRKSSIDFGKLASLNEQLIALEPNVVRFSADAKLIHRLGYELVEKHATGLAELIKNAYDADATTVQVEFEDFEKPGGKLTVLDDGHGMTEKAIRNCWMRLSTGDKERNPISPKFKRSRAGRKGIGRFAVERLGKRLVLETKTKGQRYALLIEFDWDRDFKQGQSLSQVAMEVQKVDSLPNLQSYTQLRIENLRENWNKTDLENVWKSVLLLQPPVRKRNVQALRDGKQNSPKDPSFRVTINGESERFKIDELSIETMFLDNSLARINGKVFANGKARIRVRSKKLGLDDQVILEHEYPNVGAASFESDYFIYSRNLLPQGSLGKAQELANLYGGIKVYRDGFRVLPYGEPLNDWLRLSFDVGRRTIIVPANNHNFFGSVSINRESNPGLEETSSREGLVENDALLDLQMFVKQGLVWAAQRVASERERKTSTNETMWETSQSESSGIGEMIESLESGVYEEEADIEIPKPVRQKLTSDLKKEEKKAKTREVERVHYEEMLRILASLGISVSIFGHEIEAGINRVELALSELRNQLRRLLDKKDLPKVDKHTEEIEFALSHQRELGDYITNLVSSTVKRQKKVIAVSGSIEHFFKQFDQHLNSNEIEFEIDVRPGSLRTTAMHIGEFNSVLFNFLTNSIKAIERARNTDRRIRVSASQKKGFVVLGFEDTGSGIPKRIEDRIFDPFFTTSGSSQFDIGGPGSGLGLKIVKDIASAYGGYVRVGEPKRGYATKIEFAVPAAIKK